MKVEESAPGKIILSGEYAVLDGADAIILPTKQKACVSIEEGNSIENIFISSAINGRFSFLVSKDYSVIWTEENPGKYGLFVESIFKQLKINSSKKIIISIKTSDFYHDDIKLGIGSSSAISVAIIRAFKQFYNLEMNSSTIMKNILNLHYITQGFKGSGVDIACSYANTGLIEASINSVQEQKWKKIIWPDKLYMEVIFTRKEVSTQSMIEQYMIIKKDESIQELISHLIKITKIISTYWLNQDVTNILASLNQYDLIMRKIDNLAKLDIFSSIHNEIYELAKKDNIFYKPSGAGNSDIGIAFSESLDDMSRFLKSIKQTSKNALIVKVR
jgi:phosphomevalonate kinase